MDAIRLGGKDNFQDRTYFRQFVGKHYHIKLSHSLSPYGI